MRAWYRRQLYERPYFGNSNNFLLSDEITSIHNINTLPASRWRNLWGFILTFAVTFIWVILLVSYAYFSSFSSIPFNNFQTPARAIFAVNLGSTVAVFLSAALVNEGSEILRWRLATRRNGIGIATFLALGRGTTMLGVIRLLFSGQNIGHKKWCIQRFHMRK